MNILHSIKTTALVTVAMLTASSAWGDVVEIGTAADLTSDLSSATTAEYKLTADITGDFVISATSNVTIDLNTHKVTNSTGDTFTVTSGGTLTIKGTGAVDNITNGKACIYNNGTCTLDGGTYTRSAEASTSKEDANGNSYYNILNHGTMTINEGVTVSSNGHFSSLIANGYYNYTDKDPRIGYVEGTNQAAPSLTINNGTFSGGVNTVKNDDNSTLTINGGTYTNVTQNAILNNNKAFINGGTFDTTAPGVYALYNNNYNSGVNTVEATITGGTFKAPIIDREVAKLSISGGTFTEVQAKGTTTISGGTITTLEASETATVTVTGGDFTTLTPTEGAHITISGGTFHQEIPAEYCAEGFEPKDNGNGTYGVTEFEPVAKIGETTYPSIEKAIAAAGTTATTITLIGDANESVVIPADANITLDLNGHKITSTDCAITNNGTLVLNDTEGNGLVEGKFAVCNGNNATTTISSGNYKSSEFTVMTGKNTGGKININGGTFTATDNAVVGGNGSEKNDNDEVRQDANTITITAGTFNGSIKTSGYVACGIYAPWKDEITVSGGTFNITNGAGIVARAGTVTVTGGEFNCTGTATGKVGDKAQALPCAAIVYDKTDPAYPAITPESQIKINGGEFNADVDAVQVLGTDDTKRVAVSGGTFSTPVDPAYCADGFFPSVNSDGTYSVSNGEFVVVDGKPLPIAANKTLTNVKATYTRTMPSGTTWGTVCLPFNLKPSELSTNNITLYKIASIESSTLNLSDLGQEDQPAGTPLIFNYSGTDCVSVFSTESATVNSAPLSTTGTLIGTYTYTTITTDLTNTYFINSDAFHQAQVSLTVPAYRAYIKYNIGSGSAKPSTLFINVDGETDAIDATTFESLGTVTGYYTPDGTRHTTPQPGLNIVRMTNGKTMKMMK